MIEQYNIINVTVTLNREMMPLKFVVWHAVAPF